MGEDFVTGVSLQLPEDEARALYRHLHQTDHGQDTFSQTYLQLQSHFFATLTIHEITDLLGSQE